MILPARTPAHLPWGDVGIAPCGTNILIESLVICRALLFIGGKLDRTVLLFVLNGAQVGSNCLIGAGALVTQHAVIPDGSLAFGSPARVRSALDEAAIAELRQAALNYQQEAMECKAEQEK